MKGIITKQISNDYTVTTNNNSYICKARGKFRELKLTPLVGDYVSFDDSSLVIEEILPRKNELKRPVVANIDIALIVTSIKKPDLSLSLLDKELSVILNSNITPFICLTKLDLANSKELKDIKVLVKYYKSIGIKVFDNKHLGKLKRALKHKTVVLTGQTGAGKSSLLNKLDRRLNLEAKEISESLNRGVHTTRHTEIHKIKDIFFVDTPGFSSLDLSNMEMDSLKKTFREFDKCTCAYQDCTHNKEDGCGVKDSLKSGLILPSRYINYIRFLEELNSLKRKIYK